jgi:hypothetical protein
MTPPAKGDDAKPIIAQEFQVYLYDYRQFPDAISGLGRYFNFYNSERLRQALGYRIPEAVFKQLTG